MEMFLMVACMSLFGFAVSALAFGAATRDQRGEEATAPEAAVARTPQRFFVHDAARPAGVPQVPVEVLLLQIERHIRLEQAAAESFIDFLSAAHGGGIRGECSNGRSGNAYRSRPDGLA